MPITDKELANIYENFSECERNAPMRIGNETITTPQKNFIARNLLKFRQRKFINFPGVGLDKS